MKIIFILFLFFSILYANQLTFERLREQERSLVLREFKKLYKQRQDVHQNLRQVLKHSRAKNLNKTQLSFFQPKDTHQMEASNVFFTSEIEPCDECNDNLDSVDTSVPEFSEDYTAGNEISNDINAPTEVRSPVVSPWAFK